MDLNPLTQQKSVDLKSLPTRPDAGMDRNAAEKEFKALRRELRELQHILYASGKHRLLIVLQAMDAGGKDGTIRRVFQGVNPQGIQVTSFKVPSREELAHDFLWRIHKRVPANGMISIFNRSHYEDVLVVRVDNLVPEQIWQARYRHINAFERHLAESGTTILKFYLHISRQEQLDRFRERMEDPTKHWKFSLQDFEKRKDWDAYRDAYRDVFSRCSTEHAPWHVVPSDCKWFRNLYIARTLVETLKGLDLRYPDNPSVGQYRAQDFDE